MGWRPSWMWAAPFHELVLLWMKKEEWAMHVQTWTHSSFLLCSWLQMWRAASSPATYFPAMGNYSLELWSQTLPPLRCLWRDRSKAPVYCQSLHLSSHSFSGLDRKGIGTRCYPGFSQALHFKAKCRTRMHCRQVVHTTGAGYSVSTGLERLDRLNATSTAS